MSLKEYNLKRDFKKTSEPKGKLKGRSTRKPIYVIQRHAASHLHYDLRLEIDGVLKSWALPKEPPKAKGIKRLAVMTEDHPIGYEKFHGTIPEGYGAGEVEIWDKGYYELKIKDNKKIEFTIHGKKLKGMYVLVKTNFGSKPEKSWLFFKI
ncbi:3'-phosphoesterase [Candidatus Pacearchaeota archaeon]|nr:3'-phosphoesterase [Candidatus Pacearchaeota archaeon]